MKKMNLKFVWSMLVVFAMALLSACTDYAQKIEDEFAPKEEKQKIASCDVYMFLPERTIHICEESANIEALKEDCDTAIPAEFHGEAKIGSGCSDDYLKVCNAVENGIYYTAYFYEDYTVNESCENLVPDGTIVY